MGHIHHALGEVDADDLSFTWDGSSQHEKLDACIETFSKACRKRCMKLDNTRNFP